MRNWGEKKKSKDYPIPRNKGRKVRKYDWEKKVYKKLGKSDTTL